MSTIIKPKGVVLMKVSGFFHRFLCCLLVALLLIPAALADSVNLSSMTDTEIVALLDQVNQEIVNRGINKTAKLPQGAYLAGKGKDLPAGRYIYTCLATGDDWGNLTDTVFITLNEGDKLDSGVPFSLTIMSGALFQ